MSDSLRRRGGELSLVFACPRRLRRHGLLQCSFASRTKRKRPVNYECEERRADAVLSLLINKDPIKNAVIRTGWVLITRYIINQAVYCFVI